MKITAIKLYQNGEMQESFALGGSKDAVEIREDKSYPSSLQNYVVDIGTEILLVDTGLPVETPEFAKTSDAPLYIGEKIDDFPTALKKAGYRIEDIDKIILTHKHADHSGELRMFPHAKIYVSETEADALGLTGENIVRVRFENGPYKNFSASEKVADGVYMLPAPGHTTGNSIVVVEDESLHYMIHGDITYTDEALRQNALSIIFENRELAKHSLEQVRKFVQEQNTVYLSTHTPEALNALTKKQIMQL